MNLLKHSRMGLSTAMFFAVVVALCGYFIFAAIQGDFGHFRRMQIESEEQSLSIRLAELKQERAGLENLTRRLSDEYLDLDLLDEQARKRLGYARPDEVIIR